MLRAYHLTIDILVIVPVESGDASTVANPEIDRIRIVNSERYSGPGYILVDIFIKLRIFSSQIVIFLVI